MITLERTLSPGLALVLKKDFTASIPSSLGMFVYNDLTSMVTRIRVSFGSTGRASIFFTKSVVSLTYDSSSLLNGCKWWSTYPEIFSVWQLTELTTGRPGLSFLWIFGNIYNFGVLGFDGFSPSAVFSSSKPRIFRHPKRLKPEQNAHW